MARKGEEERSDSPVGGAFFFASLISLICICAALLVLTRYAIPHLHAKELTVFLCAMPVGAGLTHYLIRNRLSVFIHEFKHSLLSHLAGNKAKELVARKQSGHFKYEYTKETAHLNAFISLAPYILPLFAMFGAVVAFSLFRHQPEIVSLVIGLGMGADLLLNARDISPHQTDITLIRGGYQVGLVYIAAVNVAVFLTLLILTGCGVSGAGVAIIDATRDILPFILGPIAREQ